MLGFRFASALPQERHSLRWLGKAFSAHGPIGCLTDLVNLAATLEAKAGVLPDLSEKATVARLAALHDRVRRGDFGGLELPRLLVNDAEADDVLVWTLLALAHRQRGTRLSVLVQVDRRVKDTDLCRAVLAAGEPGTVQVFFDPKETNADKVAIAWADLLTPATEPTEPVAAQAAA